LGGHSIQQNASGHPVTFYRFPTRLTVPTNTAVTVWAQQAQRQGQEQQQEKSIELVCKDVDKWMSDTHCTTLLCSPTGQVQGVSHVDVLPQLTRTSDPGSL